MNINYPSFVSQLIYSCEIIKPETYQSEIHIDDDDKCYHIHKTKACSSKHNTIIADKVTFVNNVKCAIKGAANFYTKDGSEVLYPNLNVLFACFAFCVRFAYQTERTNWGSFVKIAYTQIFHHTQSVEHKTY